MNAFQKLFSFKPSRRTLKAPVTLCALFAAGVLFSPGCECTGSTAEDWIVPKAPEFLSLNVADGIPSAHTKVSLAPKHMQEDIALNAATGTPTPIVKLGTLGTAEYVDATYTLSLPGSASIINTYDGRAYSLNLSVVLGTSTAPLIRNIGLAPVMVPNVIVMQADHTIGSIDIYVTHPGTDLTTVGPDASSRGYANYTIMNAIHTGATFQVRACAAGTKTVLADFGTTTAAKERTSYVFVMAEVGGHKLLKNLEYTQQ